jgi:hypothetical protein
VALARAGRGDQHGRRRGRCEHHGDGVALLAGQVGARGGRAGLLLADQLRHGPLRGGEDLLFNIEVGQGAVAFGVRRPVDAPAVGGSHAQAGHIGGIRGGDRDDAGAGPAADGQSGDLVDHRRPVDAPLQDRERPVHLEPELRHRPDRVQLLHLGHRDPRGSALARVIQRGACARGTPAGGEGRDLRVHGGQRLDLAPRGLRFPRGKPLRPCGLGRTGAPGKGAPRLGFGAAGVLPGLLVQQPQRPPARRLAVRRLVVAGEPVQLAGDGDGAGAEQVLHVLADPADLGAVAVSTGHHDVAEARELGFQDPVGDRGDGQPLVVQAARIQRPPLAVSAVGALDPVPGRHMHMQLRIPVTGQVVQKQAGDQAGAIAPLPRPRRVVTGARVGRVLFQPRDGFARGIHQRGLDLVRAGVERGGLVLVAALAGLAGGDPVGGVQHRDALDRADGQVEVRHLPWVLGPCGGADLGQLGRAGVRMRRSVGRDRGGLAVRGRLRLAPLGQKLTGGSGVLLVQALDDARIHRTAQAERRGALSGPLPRRFPGRGVVRHRSGAAATVLAAGEVGHVVARVHSDVSRHSSRPVPRSSFVMPVSDWFSSRTDGTSGQCTIYGLAQGAAAGRKLHDRKEKSSWAMTGRSRPTGPICAKFARCIRRLPTPLAAEDAHLPSSRDTSAPASLPDALERSGVRLCERYKDRFPDTKRPPGPSAKITQGARPLH